MIVDASVAVKWFMDEELSERADSVASEAYQLFAPEIIQMEVLSAVSKKFRVKTIDRIQAETAYQSFRKSIEQGVVQCTPDVELLRDAYSLSLDLSHPVPDCLYLALAMKKSMPLITADKAFVVRAKKHYDDIQCLSEFALH